MRISETAQSPLSTQRSPIALDRRYADSGFGPSHDTITQGIYLNG
jgi:hypothetical protein